MCCSRAFRAEMCRVDFQQEVVIVVPTAFIIHSVPAHLLIHNTCCHHGTLQPIQWSASGRPNTSPHNCCVLRLPSPPEKVLWSWLDYLTAFYSILNGESPILCGVHGFQTKCEEMRMIYKDVVMSTRKDMRALWPAIIVECNELSI